MQIRDISNNTYAEEQYVTNADIKEYNPCWFSNRQNPVTNIKCQQGLTMPITGELPNDKVFQIYTLSIYVLGAYLLYCLIKK